MGQARPTILLVEIHAFCSVPEERSKRTKGVLEHGKKLHPPEGQEKYCAVNVSGDAANFELICTLQQRAPGRKRPSCPIFLSNTKTTIFQKKN